NYLLMTAKEITIEKAEAWNLVAETVDASIFEKYRNRLLRSVASRSQFSIFAMKKLMQLEGTTHYCDAWEKLWSAVQTNEDFVEGRSAFMETRPQNLTGTSTTEAAFYRELPKFNKSFVFSL